jgi:hypothetical protein
LHKASPEVSNPRYEDISCFWKSSETKPIPPVLWLTPLNWSQL